VGGVEVEVDGEKRVIDADVCVVAMG